MSVKEKISDLMELFERKPEMVNVCAPITYGELSELIRDLEQRTEAAESENNYMGGGARYWHDEYCAQQKRLVAKIVDLEAKLTELEKQDAGGNPVLLYADSYRTMAKSGVTAIPIWSVITDLERNISPLFTRPLPAVSLAELVPNDKDLRVLFETWTGGSASHEALIKMGLPEEFIECLKELSWESWTSCRSEILRNIEEVK